MALTKAEASKLKKIGTRIRDVRTEKGLTLEDVENNGGPSWRLLIKVEKGKNHNISTLLKIADALGVSPADLLNVS